MLHKKSVHIALPVVIVVLLVFFAWIIWGNTALELNVHTITSKELPENFDGFRIAHISDLHNAEMGENNEKLLALLNESRPDIIAITGDFVDSRRTDISVALNFAKEAMKIAPCYYVPGNHEARVPEYESFKSGLTELGVVVLHNESTMLDLSGETIAVAGVKDPSFETDYLLGDSASVMQCWLEPLVEEETYTVLLSHRPELMEVYADSGVNLVLSGHAHGGQFRVPFIGGIFAPNQGLFPDYDAGSFTEDNTTMIVSRGIGNSTFPLRFNNRPEIVLVILSAE